MPQQTIPQQTLPYVQFFLGVGVAIAVFLIREGITYYILGFRFRTRLVLDLKMLLKNYYDFLPELPKTRKGLKNTTKLDFVPIWSNEFSLLEYLYQNSSYLDKKPFQETVHFYDMVGRFNEIRRAYNGIVQQIVTSNRTPAKSIQFLDRCLRVMEEDCRELVKCACNALIATKEKHWWLGIDTQDCRNKLANI